MSEPTFQASERRVRLSVDESVYDLDVIMGAAYLFIDRCYVYLDREADRRVSVVLRTREATTEAALEQLAGHFANELLNQALRKNIGEANAKIREFVMARALFSAEGPSTIDKLLAELDAEEMATDDLDIPVPWEKPPGA
ncbi:MAG: His-Xaa-Ser system protein HxsD [Deltaproteobacteria bacterium]|nr:His-Xaa-Ser system protein HxsD [Deltaproteobacteria bacterium]